MGHNSFYSILSYEITINQTILFSCYKTPPFIVGKGQF